MVDLLWEYLVDFSCTFIRHFGLYVHFEQVIDSGLELSLDEPKLLIHLVPQYLSKYADVIVLGGVSLDAWDNAGSCLYGQVLV